VTSSGEHKLKMRGLPVFHWAGPGVV
jgi:hypothetical protein